MNRVSALFVSLAIASIALGAALSGAADAIGLEAMASAQEPNGERLLDELGCAVCHAGVPSGVSTIRDRAPDLSNAGAQFESAYLFTYLLDPSPVQPDIGASRMPSFHLDERESLAIALYLGTLVADGGTGARREAEAESERAFGVATREHDDVTAELGGEIVRALNCAGCHAGLGTPAVAGPPLPGVGERLRDDWLRSYLESPSAVRPFGYHPGSGSRMPDFRLSRPEANAIADALEALPAPTSIEEIEAVELTAFSRDKAHRFVRDRLPCLGCHALNGDGGRIGPDLGLAADRLEPHYVRAVIEAPQHAAPGTVMPRHVMPPDRVELIANFLSTGPASSVGSYLSLADTPVSPIAVDETTGAGLYQRYCAMCHGSTGLGDGYNAAYLPTAPTQHADSAYLATRPDDTLFDGVHAGGYILNRSHRMPAFGQRLTGDQIRSIVRYMRELCRCEGPLWSRDNRSGSR